jgi:hypothetical protein
MRKFIKNQLKYFLIILIFGFALGEIEARTDWFNRLAGWLIANPIWLAGLSIAALIGIIIFIKL